MRPKRLAVSSLIVASILSMIDVGAAVAQGTPPMVMNREPPASQKKWYVWLDTKSGVSNKHFERMVVHIKPGTPILQMKAHIWLYQAVPDGTYPDGSTKYKLQLTEKYRDLPLESLNSGKPNRLSNLRVRTPQNDAKGNPTGGFHRQFLITGTQNPGGPPHSPSLPRARMLRLTTFLTAAPVAPLAPANGAQLPQSDVPTLENRFATNCEDYPDDEMLEETDLVYEDEQPEDPPYEDDEFYNEYEYTEDEDAPNPQ